MQILLIEDDRALGTFLQKGLLHAGYEVEWAQDGEAGLKQAMELRPELVVLDLGLPRMDGCTVLQEIHGTLPEASVVVLTGRGQLEERIRCLDMGADDYLLKPFSFHELNARCRAVMRRRATSSEQLLRHEDLEIDRVRRTVRRGNQDIELTVKEFALLEYLLLKRGKSVSRDELLREVWKTVSYSGTNVVDVYVNYLRRKLGGKDLIETVRGEGYCLGRPRLEKVTSKPAKTVAERPFHLALRGA